MILGCFNNIRTGATTYILSKYTMPKLLRAVQEHRITYLVMVPAVVASLIKSDVDVNRFLPSVRKVLYVASYLGKEAAQELRNLFSSLPSPPILQQNWGMTEVTGAGTVLPPSEETDGLNIGYLAPNLEARLLDDKGQLVEEGQHGELVVRGPTVFMGYWKDPKATQEGRTADGWHRTGDVMTVDRNGMWTFKGRDKVCLGGSMVGMRLTSNLYTAYHQSQRFPSFLGRDRKCSHVLRARTRLCGHQSHEVR